MSAEYVPLAIIMFVFTYPSRAVGLLAPAIDRLPRQVLDYLQLVGPAVLAALAAVDIMVGVENGESYFTIGLPWLSVGACIALVCVAEEPVPRPRGGDRDRDRRAGRSGFA